MLLLSACAVILVLAYIFGRKVVGGGLIILAVLAAIIIARAPAFAPDPPEPPTVVDQACAADLYSSQWSRNDPGDVAEVEILCAKPVTSVAPAGPQQRRPPAVGG